MYASIPGSTAHQSGPNGPITRIVIHGTVSPCQAGGARQVAGYFQSATSGGLAHYVVDPAEVVQCAPENIAVWHAPPNAGSIGIELCDPQTGPASRWLDPSHEAMLKRAAALVVDVAKRNSVPLVKIGPGDLVASKHGLCGHVDVSQAFHQSDHSDPGSDFPWGHFLSLIAAATKPAPTTPPAHAPEVDPMYIFNVGPGQYLALGGKIIHLATPADVKACLAAGAKLITLPATVAAALIK